MLAVVVDELDHVALHIEQDQRSFLLGELQEHHVFMVFGVHGCLAQRDAGVEFIDLLEQVRSVHVHFADVGFRDAVQELLAKAIGARNR